MNYFKLKKKILKNLCKDKIVSNTYIDEKKNKIVLELSCGNDNAMFELPIVDKITISELEDKILLLGKSITILKIKQQYTGNKDMNIDGIVQEMKSKKSLLEKMKNEKMDYNNELLENMKTLEKRVQEMDYSMKTTENIDIQRRLFKELQELRQKLFYLIEIIRNNI